MRPGPVLLDYLERAAWTAAQQFFAVLLATTGGTTGARMVVDLPWTFALASAGVAALVSMGTTFLQRIPAVLAFIECSFARDLAARVLKTFVGSLLGSLAALQLPGDAYGGSFWTTALNLAFITTAQSVAKGFLAQGVGREPGRDGRRSRPNPSTLQESTYRAALARR